MQNILRVFYQTHKNQTIMYSVLGLHAYILNLSSDIACIIVLTAIKLILSVRSGVLFDL